MSSDPIYWRFTVMTQKILQLTVSENIDRDENLKILAASHPGYLALSRKMKNIVDL